MQFSNRKAKYDREGKCFAKFKSIVMIEGRRDLEAGDIDKKRDSMTQKERAEGRKGGRLEKLR